MKFTRLILFAALAILGISIRATAGVSWAQNGLGVGSLNTITGVDTRIRITGTAQSGETIRLAEFFCGDQLTRPVTFTATATVYTAGYLSGTTLAFPVGSTSVSMCASVGVPNFYGSGGVIQVWVNTDVSDTAATLRVDIQDETPGSAVSTAITLGTSVGLPDLCTANNIVMTLPNAAVIKPGDVLNISIRKTAGSTAVVRIARVIFAFKRDYAF